MYTWVSTPNPGCRALCGALDSNACCPVEKPTSTRRGASTCSRSPRPGRPLARTRRHPRLRKPALPAGPAQWDPRRTDAGRFVHERGPGGGRRLCRERGRPRRATARAQRAPRAGAPPLARSERDRLPPELAGTSLGPADGAGRRGRTRSGVHGSAVEHVLGWGHTVLSKQDQLFALLEALRRTQRNRNDLSTRNREHRRTQRHSERTPGSVWGSGGPEFESPRPDQAKSRTCESRVGTSSFN